MKTLLEYAVALVIAYLAAWTASYAFVFVARDDGLDLTHYFDYLALAWTFRGGELPSFIWTFSLTAFLPLAVLLVFGLRRYEKHRTHTAEQTPSSWQASRLSRPGPANPTSAVSSRP